MKKVLRALALVAAALAVCVAPGIDATASASKKAPPGVKLTLVGKFSLPLYVTSPHGDTHREFIVQRSGAIRVLKDGKILPKPFLSLEGKVISAGERGLHSMAFAPDYAKSGIFYVDYIDLDGNSEVVEYHRSATDPDVADPSTRRVVLMQTQKQSNHKSGQLQFGPDRLLYIGLGDGGGSDDKHGKIGNGQLLSTWLGKILRINPSLTVDGKPYTVPTSNPFVGKAGIKPEIYAYGFRNPYRFSFDRATGNLVIGDVGQNQEEEVDFAKRGQASGGNYGWRVWEGNLRHAKGTAKHAIFPVQTYRHTQGRCAIIGGYVVRDPRVKALYGRYVYGDYCAGKLVSTRLSPGHATPAEPLGLHVDQLSGFGQDASGRIYVESLDGPVYRLDPR